MPGLRVFFLLFLLLGTIPWTALGGESGLIRQTRSGPVEGVAWDDGALAWLGMPYARPPVGEMRWKAPREVASWEGVRPARTFGPACPQLGGFLLTLDPERQGRPAGEEDCLYLNVWAPRSARNGLPVLVYLHGGLNVVGESSTSLYHGANLASSQQVVVVTLNYRLGMLGWLALEALASGDPLDDSGNYGVLDQIQALRWVKENIEAFGGDPGNVTLAGESGGAYDVVTLLSVAQARGLFHRAVIMSALTALQVTSFSDARRRGEAFVWRLLQAKGLARSEREARRLVKAKGAAWVRAFMRGLTAFELLEGVQPLSDRGLNGMGMTVEAMGGSRFGDGVVVPRNLEDHFRAGKGHRVPVIVGTNLDEARIFLIGLGIMTGVGEKALCRLIQGFDPAGPPVDPLVETARLRRRYAWLGSQVGFGAFERSSIRPLTRLLSPFQPVYVYRFDWRAQPPPFDFLVGASHMMELPFIFGNFQTDNLSLFRFAWREANRAGRERLSRTMQALWGNFMRTGDPNGPGLPPWTAWKEAPRGRQRLALGEDTVGLIE